MTTNRLSVVAAFILSALAVLISIASASFTFWSARNSGPRFRLWLQRPSDPLGDPHVHLVLLNEGPAVAHSARLRFKRDPRNVRGMRPAEWPVIGSGEDKSVLTSFRLSQTERANEMDAEWAVIASPDTYGIVSWRTPLGFRVRQRVQIANRPPKEFTP